MNEFFALLHNTAFWIVLGSYFLFSAFADALPVPDKTSGKLYEFFFKFVHGLAGNIKRAATRFNLPGADGPKDPQA